MQLGTAGGDDDEDEDEGGRLPLGRQGQPLALDKDAPVEVRKEGRCLSWFDVCVGPMGVVRLESRACNQWYDTVSVSINHQVSFAVVSAVQPAGATDGPGLAPIEAFVLKALAAR